MAAGQEERRSKRPPKSSMPMIKHRACYALLLIASSPASRALHHMEKRMAPVHLARRVDPTNGTIMHVTNMCSDDIWPGINTQSGTGPIQNGFKLKQNETKEIVVSHDWQGRFWGRTNCSFNENGTKGNLGYMYKACGSGDCNGVLDCKVGGDVPVTLAEFTLSAGGGQTYYDISLVDGYNLPMAIQLEPHGNTSLEDLPPNLTNPTCSGTVGLLAPRNWDPYQNNATFLGTSSQHPLPLDTKVDKQQVANWCPWDLQVNTPQPPANGKYVYPDNSVQRPAFNPCYSACAKHNTQQDCCLGKYNSPSVCKPSQYSRNAKMICPDAYSYAFDDQTSTFIVPAGVGFNIIFCPGGRSSNILSAAMHNGTSTGQVHSSGSKYAEALDCHHDMPAHQRVGACRPSLAKGDWKEQHALRVDELKRRAEYNLARNLGQEELLDGVRISDLVRRGVHLRDWEGERKRELEARQTHGRIQSLLRQRSSAPSAAVSGDAKTTLYIMWAALFLVAVFFMTL